MVGIFTSRQSAIALTLLSGIGTVCSTTGSQAATREAGRFAQTAIVTNWSLPLVGQRVGTLPEPTFVLPLDPTPSVTHDTEAKMPAIAPGASSGSTTRLGRVPVAAVTGPPVAYDDLEARGYTRAQRYRTPGDIKALQIAFQVLNAADAVTTIVCVKQADCQENNPIYGKHPRPIVVVGAKTLVGAIHYFAMRSLLPEHPGLARALGWVTVTVQGGVVGLNLSRLL